MKHVESVIKGRVELDREIGKNRKQNNQNYAPEPEIYVPAEKNQRKKSKKTKSKAGSNGRQQREGYQSMESSMRQQPQYAEDVVQTPDQQQLSARPNHTEGSSYPSVTQASAPPPDYYERQQNHQEYREEHHQNAHNESAVNQPNTSYRPSSIGGQPNNVADITERFMNSPMMTQFSDSSDPQKRPPYVNNQGKYLKIVNYSKSVWYRTSS